MKKIICLILSLSIICTSMSFSCFADESVVKDIPSCESVDNGQFCLPNKTLKKINSQLKVCKNDKSLTPEQVESCIAEVYKNLDLSKEENSIILLGFKFIKLLLDKGFNLSCDILKYGLSAVVLCSWVVLGCAAKAAGYLLRCTVRVPSAVIDIMTGRKSHKIDKLKKEIKDMKKQENFSYLR